jgi:hypothetical protein
VGFILTPLASNSSEVVSSLRFAAKKRRKNMNLTLSQVRLDGGGGPAGQEQQQPTSLVCMLQPTSLVCLFVLCLHTGWLHLRCGVVIVWRHTVILVLAASTSLPFPADTHPHTAACSLHPSLRPCTPHRCMAL